MHHNFFVKTLYVDTWCAGQGRKKLKHSKFRTPAFPEPLTVNACAFFYTCVSCIQFVCRSVTNNLKISSINRQL